MSLPSISVNKPITISMFFLAIAMFGVIAFQLLPVEMMPNVSFGDISININVRGGIPASEVEKHISRPVEEAVGSASNLKNILSIAKEGDSTTILEFEPGTNMDFAALEVREKFNRIRNKLPQEIEKPVIAKYEYTDVPVMILAVTSDRRSPEELRKIVDDRVKDRIQRIEGVARVEISGGRENKILIEVDQYKLQAFGLAINNIVDTINVNNSNLMVGEIKKTKDKLLIRSIGEFQNLEEIKNLAIATTKTGSLIRIKDIAVVKDSFLDPVAYARVNLQQVVTVYVQKESTGNTVKIAKLIKKEVENLKNALEQDIKITFTSNQAEAIEAAISQVQSSLLYGAALAIFILLLFLWDPRLVFIIASSIPLSLLLAFSLMYFSKITLNVISLSGLALGVGMLVDCAIVVLDNIFKKRAEALEQNFPLTQARNIQNTCAIEGANEMLLAIAASTLTTVVVFLPLVFINPEIRMLYSGIAITITYSLMASLLTALTLVPMLSSRLKIKITQKPALENFISPPPQPSKPPIIKRVSETLGNFYKTIISLTLTLRYLIIIICVIACLKVYQESKKLEKEFIGIAEQNKFTVFIELPTGTKLEVTDKFVNQVENLLSKVPEIKTYTAKVEPWSSKIYVELYPLIKRKKLTSQIMAELRLLTSKLDPAFIYYEEPEEVGTKEILIELYGYDYEMLKSFAMQIAQRLQSVPKFTDTKIRMREGRPEMHLLIDKTQAALFGLTTEQISLALHTHMRGLVATHYRGGSGPLLRVKDESYNFSRPFLPSKEFSRASGRPQAEETETIVRLQEKYRKSIDDLRKLSLATSDGNQIFLSQLAQFKYDLGPSEIWRKNKSRMVQVSANLGGMALGTAADKVKEVLKDLKLPKDYFWQFGGNYDKMIRNDQELKIALIQSLVLVYMILASLFESFSQPFIILMTVPLAAIGAVMALRWTKTSVGMGVFIGAIMLGGIVVNNAIVLVDRINFLKHKLGLNYGSKSQQRQAIILASFDRLRPIMMTSLTTILGLIPMALDKSESAKLWSPLAITVIGGMTISTFLTLFVIPCIYFIFKDLRLIRK